MTHLAERGVACARGFYVLALVSVFAIPGAVAQSGHELLPQRIANFSYGNGVAIDGDVAAVAGFVERHPVYNVDVATIDVYRYDGATWAFEQHLFSNDAVFYNDFGSSVQIEGDTISVGVPHTGKGAVVTFRYNGTSWVEDALIQPMSPTSLTDNFGDVTAQSGNVLVVPDTRDWDGFVDRELSYVFRHDGSAWQLEDTLRASDAYAGSGYGIAATVAGDLVVIGDPFYSVTSTISREGAAYVYDFAGSWTESQQLNAGPFQNPDARFGQSVETDGETILVGAIRDSAGAEIQAGASYVFRRQAGTWQQVQRLTASDAKQQGYFGLDAKVAGDHMIIGAPNDTRPGFVNDGGNAYFFRFDGSQWVEKTKLSLTDPVSDDRFGWSVDMDANWVIVGAPGRRQGQWRPGAAYIFPVATLVANDEGESGANFRERTAEISSVFPNPFSGRVTIAFNVNVSGQVELDVFDVLGRRVGSVIDEPLPIGRHVRSWDASEFAEGFYVFRLQSGGGSMVVTTGILSR